jgi:hypothetical protein
MAGNGDASMIFVSTPHLRGSGLWRGRNDEMADAHRDIVGVVDWFLVAHNAPPAPAAFLARLRFAISRRCARNAGSALRASYHSLACALARSRRASAGSAAFCFLLAI